MYKCKSEILFEIEENRCTRIYITDEDIPNLVRQLHEKPGNTVKVLKVDEDADVGMKVFGGEVKYENFEEIYSRYSAWIDGVFVYMEAPELCHIGILSGSDTNRVILTSHNGRVKLSDLIDGDVDEEPEKVEQL